MCYPGAEVNYEKNRYMNNINGTETYLYSIGVPLSLKEMNKIISSLSLIINGVLADKNKSDAYLYNKFYYFFGFRKWKV